MERGLLERYLADGMSLEQIGALVARDASTVGFWVKKHGLVANGRDKHAPRGGLTRSDLEPLVKQGLAVRAISDRLGVSPSTVRHWLAKFGLEKESGYRVRRRRLAEFERTGIRNATMECSRHGWTEFVLDNRGSWRCTACRSDRVATRRRQVKEILVREVGGGCVICGYDRFVGALHFHHLDPEKKAFGLARAGATRSLKRARAEAQKCVLLCANCHAEVEGGMVELPVQWASGKGLPE